MKKTLRRITTQRIASALRSCMISPNERDSNLEAANVVDGLFAIARAIEHLAEATRKYKLQQ